MSSPFSFFLVFLLGLLLLQRAAWNKNISPQDACPGVALDRNFDVAWNEGPILSSCSQQYAGNHAFSEYETQAIREVFHRLSHKIVAYIHVHGGGYNENVFKVLKHLFKLDSL